MAMNKREKAEMDALREALRIAKAMRFTEDVERDLPPPVSSFGGGPKLTKGWDYIYGGSTATAFKACSSSIHHGCGWDKTSFQQPKALFTTRLLALRALRRDVEMSAAKKLADIDRMIEEEIADPGARDDG